MARAPSSGPAGALLKLPAPLMKAVLVVGVVGSTLGATLVVATVTGASAVRIPSLAGPSYARDVSGFHPITSHSPSAPAATPSGKPATTPSSTPSGSKPPVSSPSHAPTPSESPSPPPAPSIAVSMTAASQTAKKNKTITYTIVITNNGSAVANSLVVESHVPDGASLSSWVCNGQTMPAHGGNSFMCGTLGSAPSPNHPLVFAISTLGPGASITEHFTVTVDPSVKHNSAIVDHAHAYAQNADLADSNIASVVVR